jgi:hypothetical protein
VDNSAEEEIHNLDDFLTDASHPLSRNSIKQKRDVFLFYHGQGNSFGICGGKLSNYRTQCMVKSLDIVGLNSKRHKLTIVNFYRWIAEAKTQFFDLAGASKPLNSIFFLILPGESDFLSPRRPTTLWSQVIMLFTSTVDSTDIICCMICLIY